ncbi:MAG TPA: glycosyltransferase [Pirellulaceae bacterium]|nr:glycosyltransferase [Pirellulaceae bacterium]
MMISTHGYISSQPELGKPDTGGQVVYVLELAKCLAQFGFAVDVFTRRFEGQSAMEVVVPNVRIIRIRCGGTKFIPKETLCDSIPEWARNAELFIREKKWVYSFINSHYWDAGLAGELLAKRLRIPHFHTPHSIGSWKRDNMQGDPEYLERIYNFRRRIRDERMIYQSCDKLIATTPEQRDILLAAEYGVSRAHIAVIPPGYDDRRFFPVSQATRLAIKEELGWEGKPILALGRMARNKGYDLLLRALPTVIERVPDARLVLAAGSLSPNESEQRMLLELQNLASELGIADCVTFGDYIADEQLSDTYRAADVFCLSSRYEPFGMTVVEAMGCGTPTIVTTEGGLWDQLVWGLESIYANPNDPVAFGMAIANVLMYPQIAQQLSRYGSQKVRAKFTWNGVAQRILSLIDDVEIAANVDNALEAKPDIFSNETAATACAENF